MNDDLEKIPPNVSDEERWICANRVCSIRAEYRMTGTDTADTYLHLKSTNGAEACWLDRTFNKVAQLYIGTDTVAKPAYGVVERVKARTEYEIKNARELADYRRLKAKFGDGA